MLRSIKQLPLVVLIMVAAKMACGYEVSTHAAMVREAYNRSTLRTTDLLERLGVSAYNEYLGNFYLDTDLNGYMRPRLNNHPYAGETIAGFTGRKFRDANNTLPGAPAMQSPVGWLMVGSIREDDTAESSGIVENAPQDDPPAFDRVFNHFYDPYRDIPLQKEINGIQMNLGTRTPDWAIDGTYRGPSISMFTGRNNQFTIKDAKEAMFRAATMRTLVKGQLKPLPPPLFFPTDAELSRAYWATTFKTLGNVLHLLQDMAQPQHVRNEAHSGAACVPILLHGDIVVTDICVGGQDSFYEKYLEARTTGKETFVLYKRFFNRNEPGDVTSPPISPMPLVYGGYAVPSFSNYSDYYSTGTGGASYTTGKGLANYTNKGFFSAGTNLGLSDLLITSPYPLPPRDHKAFTEEEIPANSVRAMNGNLIEGNSATLTLLDYPVTDNLYLGETRSNIPLTSYSVFNQFMEKRGFMKTFTLNHYNYNAQADLLLPRAVAYSAGLLDYFFRGNMEISLPKAGAYGIVDHAQFKDTDPINGFKGFGKIKLKLKNATKSIVAPDGLTYPQWMSDGTLVATLWFHRNMKYTDNLDGELSGDASWDDFIAQTTDVEEIIVSDPIPLSRLAYNEDTELTFNFPKELPINAVGPWLTVVFRGKLGDEEDAVIVSGKLLSSPIYYAMENDTDYVHLANKKCYTRKQIIADDALWGMLAPRCKKYLDPLAPREFSDNCTERAMNAEIDFGGEDSNLYSEWYASGGALPARRFGRVAFLTDNEGTDVTTYMWAYGSGVGDNSSFGGLAGNYHTFYKVRGVNSFGWSGLVTKGNDDPSSDTKACTAGYLTKDDPTDLQDEERIPMPTTSISGWDDP